MNKAGVKYDGDKPRWGLLPYREVQDVVDVLTFGSKKYSDDNWKNVENADERYFDAMLRHITQYRFAKERDMGSLIYDSESKKHHLAHAICCALFIMYSDNESESEFEDLPDIIDEDVEIKRMADEMKEEIDKDILHNVKLGAERITVEEDLSNVIWKLADEASAINKLQDRIKDLENIIRMNESDFAKIIMYKDKTIKKQNEDLSSLESRFDNLSKDLNARNDRLQFKLQNFNKMENRIKELERMNDAQAKYLTHMGNVNESLRQKNLGYINDFKHIENTFTKLSVHADNLQHKNDAMTEAHEKLKGLVDIQCENGNWNYDSYMHGMANALILAYHVVTSSDEECPFLNAPSYWLKDVGNENEPDVPKPVGPLSHDLPSSV